MKARHFLLIAASCWLGASCAHPATEKPVQSFVGDYDGSSFEMFAGLRLQEDGAYEFALSVGALDLRSQGSWSHRGDAIIFDTKPKPVAPAFELEERSAASDGPMITVSWPNGEAIQNIRVELACGDGSQVEGLTSPDGWSPADGECENPASIRLTEDIHEIVSPRFEIEVRNLPNLRFVLQPNDLGVLDLTGAMASLENDKLVLKSAKGEMTFRRMADE